MVVITLRALVVAAVVAAVDAGAFVSDQVPLTDVPPREADAVVRVPDPCTA